jgi:FtsZ-interacting cell division protein ZipA
MLTVGIAIMVTSVILGIIALTLVAVTSSTARSTGRSIRFAMALSDEPERTTPSYARPRGGVTSHEQEAPYQPAEEQEAPYGPAEEQDAPYQRAEEQDAAYGPAEEPNAPYQPAEEPNAPYQPAEEPNAPYRPAEEQEPYYPAEEEPGPLAAEIQDAPRWVLVMTIISGAGLVLGMLIVMVASIT